jgi:putative autoinducer-2 (AI-2) aldolase
MWKNKEKSEVLFMKEGYLIERMGWGKENRIRRIIQNDGKVVMLALDHGYFLGPTHGMEIPSEALKPLLPYVDSIMLSPGILTSCVAPSFNGGIVLRSSGGSSIISDDLSNESIILEPIEAIKLNASAMAISIFIGSKFEKQTLMNLAQTINNASKYEMPVLAVTAVGKELGKRDAKFLSLSSRIAAEFGADIVKTYYCEDFEKVINTCPKPIVIAGGPKLETERDVFELCYNAIQAGAVGVDMGRNIWQNRHPGAIVQCIRAIVHDDYKPEQAEELYKELIQKE